MDSLLSRLKSAGTHLQEVFADRYRGVVLFGSEARGEAKPDSDIDLLVLLEEPSHFGADLKTIIDVLYPIQLDLDRVIHAFPVPFRNYQAGTLGLYRQARTEGMVL